MHKKTSLSVISQCKVQSARHGIPSILATDCGPEFSSRGDSQAREDTWLRSTGSSPSYTATSCGVTVDNKPARSSTIVA